MILATRFRLWCGQKLATFLLVLLVFTLIGCANRLIEKFEVTADQVKAARKINVVVDSFVLSDITGSIPGYNLEKNKTRAALLADSVAEVLQAKGFDANVVFIGSGFQHDIEDLEITYSERWKPIGGDFSPVVLQGDPSWEQSDAAAYFDAAITEAKGALLYNPPLESAKSKQKRLERLGLLPDQEAERKRILQSPPELIAGSDSDLHLFVRYGNYDISTTKKVGLGLLTGVFSLAASGGNLISVLTFTEKGPMHVALMEPDTGQLLWGNEVEDTSFWLGEDEKIKEVLKHFPSK
jgi:hypothetical protein